MIRLGALFASTSATSGLLSTNSTSLLEELTIEEESIVLDAALDWQPANTNGANNATAAILGTENLFIFLFKYKSFPPK